MLFCISSPYARRGELWNAYRKYFGKEDRSVLVWQADSRSMNPNISTGFIQEAYERDSLGAAAEYGAQFRRDVESFVSLEAVEAVTIPGRLELPPTSHFNYAAFVDPSGGSQDSMTLAIAHREDRTTVLDAIREIRPPFSPEDATEELVSLLKRYGISRVTGDRFGGEWTREKFRQKGVEYRFSKKSKNDLYRDVLPLINSKQVELLDHPRLITQLVTLERRTSRSGRDSIDHPPGAHDDLVNAAAGALVLSKKRKEVFCF